MQQIGHFFSCLFNGFILSLIFYHIQTVWASDAFFSTPLTRADTGVNPSTCTYRREDHLHLPQRLNSRWLGENGTPNNCIGPLYSPTSTVRHIRIEIVQGKSSPICVLCRSMHPECHRRQDPPEFCQVPHDEWPPCTVRRTKSSDSIML